MGECHDCGSPAAIPVTDDTFAEPMQLCWDCFSPPEDTGPDWDDLLPADDHLQFWRKRLHAVWQNGWRPLRPDDPDPCAGYPAGFYCGFWRHRGVPVVTWESADGPMCRVGHSPAKRATPEWVEEVFGFVAAHPVPAHWIEAFNKGGVWPDEHPALRELPADAFDGIALLAEAARSLLPLDTADPLACRQAQGILEELYSYRKEAADMVEVAGSWIKMLRAEGLRRGGQGRTDGKAPKVAAARPSPLPGDNRHQVDRLADVREQIRLLQAEEKALREAIIQEMGDREALGGDQHIVRRSAVEQKGALDTDLLKEAVGTLDSYRKPATTTVRLTIEGREQ